MSTEQFYLQPRLKSGLRTAIQIIIPVVLILGTVRIILVTAKTWIPYAYRLSGFPDNRYSYGIQVLAVTKIMRTVPKIRRTGMMI